jgi:hypothetical protein
VAAGKRLVSANVWAARHRVTDGPVPRVGRGFLARIMRDAGRGLAAEH